MTHIRNDLQSIEARRHLRTALAVRYGMNLHQADASEVHLATTILSSFTETVEHLADTTQDARNEVLDALATRLANNIANNNAETGD